jgi:hypothetical protein
MKKQDNKKQKFKVKKVKIAEQHYNKQVGKHRMWARRQAERKKNPIPHTYIDGKLFIIVEEQVPID